MFTVIHGVKKKKRRKKKTKKKINKRGETDDKMIQEAPVSSTHGLKHQSWYWKQKGRKELLTKQHKGSINDSLIYKQRV